MKQGMLFGVAALAFSLRLATAAETTSGYAQAEREYEAAVSARVQRGLCSVRNDSVLEAQGRLAQTVAVLPPTAGPRILLFAVTANDVASVRRLLAAGSPRVGDNGTLLHAAAGFGDVPLLVELTAAGVGLEERGGAGRLCALRGRAVEPAR